LQKNSRLWVFGDSYTTPHFKVEPAESFWGLAAVELGVQEIVNCSWPGNSWMSVMHMVISMQQQFDLERDVLLVGIPPLERFTAFDNFRNTQYQGIAIGMEHWQETPYPISCHTGLEIVRYDQSRSMTLYEDRSWTETRVLADIFLLTQWLDTNHARYVMINLSKSFDRDNYWGPSEFLLPYALEHPRCILFDRTYRSVNLDVARPADFDQYGWDGHHGAEGNRNFFESSLKDYLC